MPRSPLTVDQLTPAQRDVLRHFPPAGNGGEFDLVALAELRGMTVLQDDHGADELTPLGRELQRSLLNGVMLPPIER